MKNKHFHVSVNYQDKFAQLVQQERRGSAPMGGGVLVDQEATKLLRSVYLPLLKYFPSPLRVLASSNDHYVKTVCVFSSAYYGVWLVPSVRCYRARNCNFNLNKYTLFCEYKCAYMSAFYKHRKVLPYTQKVQKI